MREGGVVDEAQPHRLALGQPRKRRIPRPGLAGERPEIAALHQPLHLAARHPAHRAAFDLHLQQAGLRQIGRGHVRIGRQWSRHLTPRAARFPGNLECDLAVPLVVIAQPFDRRLSPIAGDIDNQVYALRGREDQFLGNGFRRGQRHPVQRHLPARKPGQSQHENPRIGGVDQAQAQPLMSFRLQGQGVMPVGPDQIAEAPTVAEIHRMGEIRLQLRGVGIEQPIVEQQHLVAIDIRRVGLLDDQRTGEAARDLLHRIRMRVIPIGTRVRRDETIVEGLAGRHGVLRQPRHAIHRIVDADAVPMHRAWHIELVDKAPLQARALRHPQLRPRQSAVIGPDLGLRIALGGDLGHGALSGQRRRGGCRVSDARRQRRGPHSGKDRAAGQLEILHLTRSRSRAAVRAHK